MQVTVGLLLVADTMTLISSTHRQYYDSLIAPRSAVPADVILAQCRLYLLQVFEQA